MEVPAGDTLARLFSIPVAALGTLDGSAPRVSMVSVASSPALEGFVIHVSRLAAHTRDLEADPRASLMWMAPWEGQDPLALPRVTVGCTAEPVSEAEEEAATRAYLSRFPQAEPLLAFPDFALWRLKPGPARLVAGFGRAMDLDPVRVLEVLEVLEA